MKKILNNNRGITLIALIVTIIVILILAGVSISVLSGENGIINNAIKSKILYQSSGEDEKIRLAYTAHRIDVELKRISALNVEGATVQGDNNQGWTITFDDSLNSYSLTSDGNITPLGRDDDTITSIKIIVNSGADGNVKIPIDSDIDCEIDWGDGTKTARKNNFERELNKVASQDELKIAQRTLLSGNTATPYEKTYDEKNKDYLIKISGNVTKFGVPLVYNAKMTWSNDKLLEIIQWGETGLDEVDMSCPNLRRIVSPSESSFASLQSFSVRGCRILKYIPDDILSGCSNLTDAGGAFSGWGSLKEIPEGLFDNCHNIESFRGAFDGCSNLIQIPTGLFDDCEDAINFSNTFLECTSLVSIPTGLFDNCTQAEDFDGTFVGCESLINIPQGLFDYCVQARTIGAFAHCTALKQIPEGLFDNCVNVEIFDGCFTGCGSLERIPEGLFDNCTEVTSFYGLFSECTSITQIPENLFSNCDKVESFAECFSGCTGITQIPANLFSNCNSEIIESFDQCFSGCTSLTGMAPEIWEIGMYGLTGIECFKDCIQLLNYEDIPIAWK